MRKYLDKDFFKFLSGFIVILLISLTIILLAKGYELKTVDKGVTADVAEQ